MIKAKSAVSNTIRDSIEHSPIAVAVIDSDGSIARSNTAFKTLIGKAGFKDSDRNFLDMTDNEGRAIIQKLFDGNEPAINQRPSDITLGEPSEVTASLFLGPMEDYGYMVHLIDTTEQKNLELRFVQAQKMQAVGQLAGGVAHDFNNLLTAMIGFCDLLLIRHPPSDPSFADVMQIKQNANRAANLVRQLLAFSRQQTLQPEVINLTDTLAELSNLIRRLIGENIQFKMSHGRDIWPVRVDQGQFEQVVINLAVNARDAMSKSADGEPSMGGDLTIRSSNVTIDKDNPLPLNMISSLQDKIIINGDHVLVEVVDTGHGMSRKIMRQIFEPFFTTKDVGEGTGLGLSTVYGIIEQTGGQIYVSSEEGEGTTFSIYLKKHEASEEESSPEEVEIEEAKDLTGEGIVLIVEDEDAVRIFSSRALTNKGYTVLEANSGEAALTIVEERGKEIDVIITDVVMPGITGPAMVKDVMAKYPEISVIFISGYGEDVFSESYGSSREFEFLPKPYTLEQLATKVKDVAGRKGKK